MIDDATPHWFKGLLETHARASVSPSLTPEEKLRLIELLEEAMLVNESFQKFRSQLQLAGVDNTRTHFEFTEEGLQRIFAEGLACLNDGPLIALAMDAAALLMLGELVQEAAPPAWTKPMHRVYEDYGQSMANQGYHIPNAAELLSKAGLLEEEIEGEYGDAFSEEFEEELAEVFLDESTADDESTRVEWIFTLEPTNTEAITYSLGNPECFSMPLHISLAWDSQTSVVRAEFSGDLGPGQQVSRSIRWGRSREEAEAATRMAPPELSRPDESWQFRVVPAAAPRPGDVVLAEYADLERQVEISISRTLY